MAVTAALYGKVFTAAFNGEIDLDDDDINVSLHTDSYTPDQDADDYYDDVDNEVSGAGYTSGGATLSGKSISYTGATNKWVFDAADVSWANSTITARYGVLYDDSGSAATSPLIGYQNFGTDVSTTNGTFQITWNASGIIEITVGAEA